MTKTRKILLFSVLGLVLLLVVVAVALPFVVDVNSFRPTIESTASEALGRPVRLGQMSLRVFPSIAVSVKNPVVGSRPDEGGGDLLTATGLDVGARLMPLLRGRLEITDVVLREPQVELRRLDDGTWNIARLVAAAPADDTGAASAPPVALESLSIRDARLVVHDAGWPEVDSVLEGMLSANVAVTGAIGGDLQVDGDLSVRSTLPLSVARGGPMPLALDVRFGVGVTGAGARIEIAPLSVDIDDNTLHGRAVLEPASAAPVTEAILESASFDVGWLERALAALGSDVPVSFSSSDPLQASGRLDRAPDGSARIAGRVEVSSFTFQHASMAAPAEEVRGILEVTGDRLAITGFGARIGTSDVGGQISVDGFDAPRVRFDLKSERADFWELFSFVAGDAGSTAAGSTATPAPPGGAALDKLQADGTLTIGSGAFGTLDFTGLAAGLSLAGDVLRLDPFEMALYDGTFEGTARVDVSGAAPSFSIDTRLAGVDSNALLVDNLQMADTLAGALSGRMKANGRGADYEAIVRSLSGGGVIELVDGRLGKLEVLEMLTKASGVFGEQSVARLSRQLEKEGTTFTLLRGNLVLAGEKVKAAPLLLEAPELTLKGNGTLNLLSARLDAEVGIVFSEELSTTMRAEKSRAADIFWDTKIDRVHLPLTMSGPADAPVPGIDWGSAAGQLARRKAEETVRSKLGDLLGVKTPPAEETPLAGTVDSAAATADPGPSPAATAAGAEARISDLDWGGNLLKPDLKIAGTVRGPLQSAAWEVTDARGTRIDSGPISWDGGADLAAGVPFSLRVKGEKLLLAKKPFTVTVRVTDTAGETASATTTARR